MSQGSELWIGYSGQSTSDKYECIQYIGEQSPRVKRIVNRSQEITQEHAEISLQVITLQNCTNTEHLSEYSVTPEILSQRKKSSIFYWFIDVAHVAFSVVSPGEPGSNFDGDCSFNFLGRG